MNLPSKKVTRKGDIPEKILEKNLSVYTKELTKRPGGHFCTKLSKTVFPCEYR